MAVIVPHGVLFRGGSEGEIRQALLEADLVEAVIGLPPNLFYGTGIPMAVLVINKHKPTERSGKVLFINANRDFAKAGTRNTLQPENISRIVDTFDAFAGCERFSRVVGLDEIRENSFNLNVSRYADTSELAWFLERHNDKYDKHTVGSLATQITSGSSNGEFKDISNSVYVPKMMGSKRPTDKQSDLGSKHDQWIQVVLVDGATNSYIAQFLGSSIGQHALAVLSSGNVTQRISIADLQECMIALPSLDDQREIVGTHHKLAFLKESIEKIDRELSLNPTGLSEVQQQLDAMLSVAEELTEADDVRGIIRQGESKTVEFKETFSLDIRKQTKEKYIETSALKTIVGFLNSEGGVLLVGVSDAEEIVGVDAELEKFHKGNLDNFLKHVKNNLKSRIGEAFYPFIDYHISETDGRKVLFVDCKASESPCFLDANDFYVRTNPATDKLEGPKFLEYVKHRFGS